MTERDAVKQVVEKSITRTVDIEVLRKWCKEEYYAAIMFGAEGRANAFRAMIGKLDELEVDG